MSRAGAENLKIWFPRMASSSYQREKSSLRYQQSRIDRQKSTKKEPPGDGGSRVKQGGVKQSGQEPLDVQKWTPTMMVPIS